MSDSIDAHDPKTVCVFTDGSCHPNPNGNGGWAFYLTYGGKQAVRYGHVAKTSNNAMELLALLRVMQFVPAGECYGAPFLVYTDSKYALNAVVTWAQGWREGGWKTSNGKPVKNRKTVEHLHNLYLLHTQHRQVEIRWVRGHSGIPQNELVDRSANNARKNVITNWKPRKDVKTKL